MNEKLKNLAGKFKAAVSNATNHEDAKIAAEWAKRCASTVGDEAAKLGKEAMRSDMAKEAAAGAAVGAVIAIPVPVIGPIAGAAIGASLGVYKNIMRKESGSYQSRTVDKEPKDICAELIKLDELRQKGIITDAEFENQKSKLLKGSG